MHVYRRKRFCAEVVASKFSATKLKLKPHARHWATDSAFGFLSSPTLYEPLASKNRTFLRSLSSHTRTRARASIFVVCDYRECYPTTRAARDSLHALYESTRPPPSWLIFFPQGELQALCRVCDFFIFAGRIFVQRSGQRKPRVRPAEPLR